jgi:hypothetical protein
MHHSELEKSYREAIYAINDSGIYIKVGRKNKEIDHILEDYNAKTWAFVTAWNPGGKTLTREENLERQIKLLLEIQQYILMEGYGAALDKSWSEDSFFVVGISEKAAIEVCNKYEQAALLFGEKGGEAQIIFL